MKFNRPAKKEVESTPVNINMDAFEDEIRLDEDVDLVAQYDEEYEQQDLKESKEPVSVQEEVDVHQETEEEIPVEMTEKTADEAVEEVETVEEEKEVEKPVKMKGEVTMNLKERLQKINKENAEMVAEVEETLTEEAMESNATSMTLSVDEAHVSYLKKYLEDNGLAVSILDDGSLTVAWA